MLLNVGFGALVSCATFPAQRWDLQAKLAIVLTVASCTLGILDLATCVLLLRIYDRRKPWLRRGILTMVGACSLGAIVLGGAFLGRILLSHGGGDGAVEQLGGVFCDASDTGCARATLLAGFAVWFCAGAAQLACLMVALRHRPVQHNVSESKTAAKPSAVDTVIPFVKQITLETSAVENPAKTPKSMHAVTKVWSPAMLELQEHPDDLTVFSHLHGQAMQSPDLAAHLENPFRLEHDLKRTSMLHDVKSALTPQQRRQFFGDAPAAEDGAWSSAAQNRIASSVTSRSSKRPRRKLRSTSDSIDRTHDKQCDVSLGDLSHLPASPSPLAIASRRTSPDRQSAWIEWGVAVGTPAKSSISSETSRNLHAELARAGDRDGETREQRRHGASQTTGSRTGGSLASTSITNFSMHSKQASSTGRIADLAKSFHLPNRSRSKSSSSGGSVEVRQAVAEANTRLAKRPKTSPGRSSAAFSSVEPSPLLQPHSLRRSESSPIADALLKEYDGAFTRPWPKEKRSFRQLARSPRKSKSTRDLQIQTSSDDAMIISTHTRGRSADVEHSRPSFSLTRDPRPGSASANTSPKRFQHAVTSSLQLSPRKLGFSDFLDASTNSAKLSPSSRGVTGKNARSERASPTRLASWSPTKSFRLSTGGRRSHVGAVTGFALNNALGLATSAPSHHTHGSGHGFGSTSAFGSGSDDFALWDTTGLERDPSYLASLSDSRTADLDSDANTPELDTPRDGFDTWGDADEHGGQQELKHAERQWTWSRADTATDADIDTDAATADRARLQISAELFHGVLPHQPAAAAAAAHAFDHLPLAHRDTVHAAAWL